MSRLIQRAIAGAVVVAGVGLLTSAHGRAQVTRIAATPEAYALGAERQVGPIRILPIHSNVFMLASAEGNSTVQVGDDGVVVVDTMTAALAPRLVEAIRSLSLRPILQIINTNAGRTGGNEIIRAAGRPVGQRDGGGAGILAFESVLNRMSADGSAAPRLAWPTDTYFVARKDTYFNGEAVHLYHSPAAYSDGDTLVFFRKSDVVSVGDIFIPLQYPRIDLEHGGSLNGVLAGLNQIIDLTVPELNEEGGTMVVPAVGHLSDEADVADYRDMVAIVLDRIQEMVRRRMTLDQVKAAKPTRDYDTVYSTPAYTGEMFIEAAYKSLSATLASATPARKGGGR